MHISTHRTGPSSLGPQLQQWLLVSHYLSGPTHVRAGPWRLQQLEHARRGWHPAQLDWAELSCQWDMTMAGGAPGLVFSPGRTCCQQPWACKQGVCCIRLCPCKGSLKVAPPPPPPQAIGACMPGDTAAAGAALDTLCCLRCVSAATCILLNAPVARSSGGSSGIRQSLEPPAATATAGPGRALDMAATR